MSIDSTITRSDGWFIGEDKSFVYTIYQSDGTTPQNITGWGISWKARFQNATTDSISKTAAITTALSGITTVTVEDADTESLEPGTYTLELKRTDSGSETVLAVTTATLRHSIHG